MRKLALYLLLPLLLLSCQQDFSVEERLSSTDWYDIIAVASSFSGTYDDTILVCNTFENRDLNGVLVALYQEMGSYLNYSSNETIEKYLSKRKNREISAKLDTIASLNIHFVNDTAPILSSNPVVSFSEPYAVTENILCISISKIWELGSKEDQHWVFFFDNSGGYFRLKAYYDYQVDDYFMGQDL